MSFRRNTLCKYIPLYIAALYINCKDNNSGTKNKKSSVIKDTLADLNRSNMYIDSVPKNMKWIVGREFTMGARNTDKMAMNHERPSVRVKVDGFYIDIHEVTNADFAKFVQETNYLTMAEREIDWDIFRKQLPPGTPRPADSILQAGSLTFKKTKSSMTSLFDYSQWWNWTIGANWRHPHGPNSSIMGKEMYPVVHIAYEYAVAYCQWAGRRLRTEAEWELAARGTNDNSIYFWGDDLNQLKNYANTWDGEFPVENNKIDGYKSLAPVQSYLPNDNGLHDMAGNAWEWTQDWYSTEYFKDLKTSSGIWENPRGAERPYNSNNPLAKEKVIKGGSYLCSASYCASYRISARMASSLDSSLENLGFRTVVTPAMLDKN